jgi:hypothetical protein
MLSERDTGTHRHCTRQHFTPDMFFTHCTPTLTPLTDCRTGIRYQNQALGCSLGSPLSWFVRELKERFTGEIAPATAEFINVSALNRPTATPRDLHTAAP